MSSKRELHSIPVKSAVEDWSIPNAMRPSHESDSRGRHLLGISDPHRWHSRDEAKLSFEHTGHAAIGRALSSSETLPCLREDEDLKASFTPPEEMLPDVRSSIPL
mmetsp:Transcript_15750/g.59946  ORF Transcript_15750/g.59946 Transcript_15750/m.59946 type:complete len:105 (+) Transcript_15750:616-930(+)